MANQIDIKTPRGQIIYTKAGKATLRWNPEFSPKWRSLYGRAQFSHDKKAWDACQLFTPKKKGALILSGKLGSRFGTGILNWVAPYARYQYYLDRTPSPGLRGPFWFQRMKELYGNAIITDTIKDFKLGTFK